MSRSLHFFSKWLGNSKSFIYEHEEHKFQKRAYTNTSHEYKIQITKQPEYKSSHAKGEILILNCRCEVAIITLQLYSTGS